MVGVWWVLLCVLLGCVIGRVVIGYVYLEVAGVWWGEEGGFEGHILQDRNQGRRMEVGVVGVVRMAVATMMMTLTMMVVAVAVVLMMMLWERGVDYKTEVTTEGSFLAVGGWWGWRLVEGFWWLKPLFVDFCRIS